MLKEVDYEFHLSDEEPFLNSGSEYLLDSESDSEQNLCSGEEEILCEDDDVQERMISRDLKESSEPIQKLQEYQVNWNHSEFIPTVYKFDSSNSTLQNKS
nr:unnamed protein product [Callosobruchus analis]